MPLGGNRAAMMRRIGTLRLFVFAGILAGMITPAGAAQPGWQLVKDENKVQVYEREIEGSVFREYQAVTVVDAPVTEVSALYEKPELMPQWYHQCRLSTMFKELGPDDEMYYFVIEMPWPFEVRDAAYRRTRSVDEGSGAIEYKLLAIPDSYPPQEGKIRIPELTGLWRFTPREDGRTEVLYRQYLQAGGNVPSFFVNQYAAVILYNTLLNSRKLVERPGKAG